MVNRKVFPKITHISFTQIFCAVLKAPTSASYHSGEINKEATPVPIPNTEVKLFRAEDTWLETARESRYSPDFFMQKIIRYDSILYNG